MDRLKRSIFLDNLSQDVTMGLLETALGGNIVNVQLQTRRIRPSQALVEFETEEQAQLAIEKTVECRFTYPGMPGPVTAFSCAAGIMEKFGGDHQKQSDLGTSCQHSDPDFEVAKILKNLVENVEASMLLQCQLEEEEKKQRNHDKKGL